MAAVEASGYNFTEIIINLSLSKINSRLTAYEYEQVLDYFDGLGLANGCCQEMEAATTAYIPNF